MLENVIMMVVNVMSKAIVGNIRQQCANIVLIINTANGIGKLPIILVYLVITEVTAIGIPMDLKMTQNGILNIVHTVVENLNS